MDSKEYELSDRERIAKRLKEARLQSGLKQEQAANLLNIQRPTISEIEAGRRKVSAEEIIQFADLYKVNPSWLLLEDDGNIDPSLMFAARELEKYKQEDIKKLIDILKILPK
ncbi:helix-turn-helix domain-containing protein [Flagellimonas algicola]|uniref:Helix-turn-helix domain-containing protein n=1 Tax=Flagellimonas algicola TaxID=2583815 RepID=A0ABY2WJP1_9FLAO|nr:helix-turn-helix transcriptional regulator [Allomuricauda algicola]TMU54815.1 helix-turn-helix domain-containing protein [Allomuricauda algicola]